MKSPKQIGLFHIKHSVKKSAVIKAKLGQIGMDELHVSITQVGTSKTNCLLTLVTTMEVLRTQMWLYYFLHNYLVTSFVKLITPRSIDIDTVYIFEIESKHYLILL